MGEVERVSEGDWTAHRRPTGRVGPQNLFVLVLCGVHLVRVARPPVSAAVDAESPPNVLLNLAFYVPGGGTELPVKVLCDDVEVMTVWELRGVPQEEEMQWQQNCEARVAEIPVSGK